MTGSDATYGYWRELAAKELKGADPDTLVWHTPEGIDVKPLYTADDLEGLETVGAPARLRALRPRAAGDDVRQPAVDDPPVRRASPPPRSRTPSTAQNLAAGQMGLSVAFDLATHRGYDSDHPRVVGDVGKAGVAIDSVEDMKILFDGIPLDQMTVSMTMNGAVLPVLAGYVVAAEEQGVDAGSCSAGPSRTTSSKSSWSATPTSIRPSRACGSSPTSSSTRRRTCRSSTRSRSPATTCRRPARPRCRSSASRSPTGWSTCAAATARGLDVDAFAGRLSFFFAIGMNFFMEVAKLRAARLLWARIMTHLRRQEAGVVDAAHALPDVGRVAHRAGPVQQRRAHRVRGDGGGARWHAEPAHQQLRRGHCAARPTSRPASPATRS